MSRPGRDRDDKGRDPRSGRTYDALAQSDASDITSHLLAGPVTFGLIGKGLDLWLGTSVLLPVGVLGGLLLSLYVVWVRYGRS